MKFYVIDEEFKPTDRQKAVLIEALPLFGFSKYEIEKGLIKERYIIIVKDEISLPAWANGKCEEIDLLGFEKYGRS